MLSRRDIDARRSGERACATVRRSLDFGTIDHARGPEWLVANGLGGYSAGTVLGPPTRRYHGLLVAALSAPLGRVIMLNHLHESISASQEDAGSSRNEAIGLRLRAFHLDDGLPIWDYEVRGHVIEKRVFMAHAQNTVHVLYRVVSGGPLTLRAQPWVKFRSLAADVDVPVGCPYLMRIADDRYELREDSSGPHLRLWPASAVFDARVAVSSFFFPLEAERGYRAHGLLWSPGVFAMEMSEGDTATISASTEAWETLTAHTPQDALRDEGLRRKHLLERAVPAARHGLAAELVLAADQFIVTPAATRRDEHAHTRAAGDNVRSVIAGYHWFTDWGRDAMISLEGLTLVTGRADDARSILRTFARYVRDGLVPNLFPEGQHSAVYYTADATLWFFHALARYLDATGDWKTLRDLLPQLMEIFEHHVAGTRFNIGIDRADGLLQEGAPGYALTWMDAKVGDWVVTPRRGKAVEVNALWYNALRLLERWLRQTGDERYAKRVREHAERARESFNRRYWYAGGYLYDVVDGEHGNDSSCRPNQIFAVSLDYPVLDMSRWHAVLAAVSETLLTPRGLRTLAPADPEYKPRYDGDRRARDAAYHEGTVWPWLIGAYVDAWLKVHPAESARARQLLDGFSAHLSQGGVGYVSEIFDAEPPFRPRGCVAQAWSVAELLRGLARTAA